MKRFEEVIIDFRGATLTLTTCAGMPIITHTNGTVVELDNDHSDYFVTGQWGFVSSGYGWRKFRVYSPVLDDNTNTQHVIAQNYFYRKQLNVIGDYLAVIKEHSLELLTPDLKTVLALEKSKYDIACVDWNGNRYYIIEHRKCWGFITVYNSKLEKMYQLYGPLKRVFKGYIITNDNFFNITDGTECGLDVLSDNYDEKYRYIIIEADTTHSTTLTFNTWPCAISSLFICKFNRGQLISKEYMEPWIQKSSLHD